MHLSEVYGPNRFGLSFELFPPKTDAGELAMHAHLGELMAFAPSYVTCTYGAGGSTREKTLRIVADVHRRYGCPVASHLTCVGATADELRAYLDQAWEQGIENIVALRGDPPRGETKFCPTAGGFCYASELVALIHREFPDFGIAVAGYPETHQEAHSAEHDLANLKRKVDAGASVIITQLFYDNADFFRFRDRVQSLGITVPIVPGILPVTNLAQIKRITSLCKARLPEELVESLSLAGDDDAGQFEAGVEFATRQVAELIEAGVPGVHFYVLNKSPAAIRVLRGVGHTTGQE